MPSGRRAPPSNPAATSHTRGVGPQQPHPQHVPHQAPTLRHNPRNQSTPIELQKQQFAAGCTPAAATNTTNDHTQAPDPTTTTTPTTMHQSGTWPPHHLNFGSFCRGSWTSNTRRVRSSQAVTSSLPSGLLGREGRGFGGGVGVATRSALAVDTTPTQRPSDDTPSTPSSTIRPPNRQPPPTPPIIPPTSRPPPPPHHPSPLTASPWPLRLVRNSAWWARASSLEAALEGVEGG